MVTRFIVEQEIGSGGWENTWSDDNAPMEFTSFDDAVDEIRDHITDCINAVESGDMDDSPDPADFRIVEEEINEIGNEVKEIYTFTGNPWEYKSC